MIVFPTHDSLQSNYFNIKLILSLFVLTFDGITWMHINAFGARKFWWLTFIALKRSRI